MAPADQSGTANDADVLDLGEHCAECNQLDFLPFKCPDCKRSFCGEHRLAHARCAGAGATSAAAAAASPRPASLIVCPLCAKGVNVAASETPDQAHARHARARDPLAAGGRPECDPDNWSRVHARPQCSAAGCRSRPVTSERIRCGRCGALLCLKHRLPEDHACPGLEREKQQLERQRQKRESQGAGAGAGASARLLAGATTAARKAVAAARPTPPRPAAALATSGPGSNSVAGTAAARARALALPELCPLCPRAADARFATVPALIDHCERAHGTNAGRDVLMERARRRGGQQGGGGEGGGSGSGNGCSKCVVS